MQAQPAQWHECVKAFLGKASGPGFACPPSFACATPADESGEWWCRQCDREFATRSALGAHLYACHGHRSDARRFIDDSGVCPVCRAVFHSRLRVLKHVQGPPYGAALCSQIVSSGALPAIPTDRVAAMDAADSAHRRSCRRAGASVLQGPPAMRPTPSADPLLPDRPAAPSDARPADLGGSCGHVDF